MNSAIVEIMQRTGNTLPEAHFDVQRMAALAQDIHSFTGFENIGVPFCMTVEAELLGSQIDHGTLACEPKIAREIFPSISDVVYADVEQLAQSGRMKIVADAAHQIRTPLAVLTSKLETALQYSGEKNSALLQQLLAVTQRTSHLTNQLLSLSRIENSGSIEMNLKPINMLEMIREVAASYVILAEKSNIQLDFRLEDCEILGDSLLLQEVLGNLLDNTFRYSGKGSAVIVALHRRASSIELSVCDNGVGVKPEQLEKLGQAFFRGNTTDNEGCGLGLTIVTEIIKLHRGHLSYSIPAAGRGLCVKILFG